MRSSQIPLMAALRHILLFLDCFLTRRPFVLESLVQRFFVDILLPPLPPASQEDLIRVCGQILSVKSSKDAGGACS